MASTHNDDPGGEWPQPSTAQQKARKLYMLRHEISQSTSRPDSSSIKILTETKLPGALLAKDLHNEENLLMYAAAMGRGKWFRHIAKEIRDQMGVQALVKGLRELDINGAPILSRAAASRGEKRCFHDVYDELREVLGMGGVMEQLKADDYMGRNIIMHAARGNHVEVFTHVYDLYKQKMAKQGRWYSEENSWREKVKKKDRTGRTMLHHAAEAGCLDILQKVIKIAEGKEDNDNASIDTELYGNMTDNDHNERTPLMLILRNSWGDCNRTNDQVKKFDELWKRGVKGGWMKRRDINFIKNEVEENVYAKTELLHAVRGGSSSLRLFLDHVTHDDTSSTTKIELDDALGMEEKVEGGKTPIKIELLQQFGHGMLLAAAAKGGHVDVMEQVVSAINNGHFEHHPRENKFDQQTQATNGIDTDDETSPVAESKVANETETDGGTKADDRSRPSRGEPMKNAITSIKDYGSSLFTLAVMSGNPKAAGYARDIIRDNFDQAEEVWDLVSGAPGETSPLTHAVTSFSEYSVRNFGQTAAVNVTAPTCETNGTDETGPNSPIRELINAIKNNGRPQLTPFMGLANQEAGGSTYSTASNSSDEASITVSWASQETSPSTHAIAPLEAASDGGEKMFDEVYDCLKKAAQEVERPKELEYHFVPSPGQTSETRVTPLAAAALGGNWLLFKHIYTKYELLVGRKWFRDEVVLQVPKSPPKAFRLEVSKEMHETAHHVDRDLSLRGNKENFSAVMWKDIVEAFQRATTGGKDENDTFGENRENQEKEASGEKVSKLPSWRGQFASYSRDAVKTATDERFFEDLRELVKEGFPLHDMVIPKLLEHIEDHEQDIIDIVTYAVGNASNPFVMAASVSKNLRTAEIERPMHRNGLGRLRRDVDDLMIELLDKLPHTVRGMGMTLLRPILPEGSLALDLRQRRNVLANLVGFIVVEWMLEPGLLLEKDANSISVGYIQGANGPAYVDPLRRAVDRGSEALEFLSKPLVLDYLHVKFMCTLPHFAAKTVVQSTVNEGFYNYHGGKGYQLTDFWPPQTSDKAPAASDVEPYTWLLRFLQGIKQGSEKKSKDKTNTSNGRDSNSEKQAEDNRNNSWNNFPHTTLLPGLQFLLAGIIGKPAIFFQVPAVLFTFELFSYLTMLGLFCWSVVLERHDHIPPKEWCLYVFAAGLIWREVLEFLDGMPLRRRGQRRGGCRTLSGNNPKDSRIPPGGKDMERMVSACIRYIVHDTWNFIDIVSIIFIVAAFIFRVRGTRDSGSSASPSDDFFIAQFFLAASTPFFFARLLLLSQIDETLGPMIQILWRLVSHTARFAVFIVVVMTSFALAFYSLFFSCEEDSTLNMHFGKFHRSLLTVFAAGLGEFGTIIDDFNYIEDQCEDLAPELAYHASICLLVAYLVVMAVVLLNLLIAVLSTAHQEVYAKRTQEFYLARARLILQNAQAVVHRRIPVPFNLIQALFGILFDLLAEIQRQYYNITWYFGKKTGTKKQFEPFTSTPAWSTIEGCLQRLAFAFTFGLFAVVLLTLLWAVSLPWVAWSLMSWLLQLKISSGNFFERGGQSPQQSQAQTKDEQPEGPNGHFRTLLFILISGAISIPALACAALLGILCSMGSIILWFRGLFGVYEWVRSPQTKNINNEKDGKVTLPAPMPGHERVPPPQREEDGKLTLPAPMPGQEDTGHWENAWSLAKGRNCRINDDKESVHFHVAPLLKSTTGLSMGDLISLVEEQKKAARASTNRN